MLHANFIDPLPGFFLSRRVFHPRRVSAFVRARLKDNIYAPFMRRSRMTPPRGVASVQKCAMGCPIVEDGSRVPRGNGKLTLKITLRDNSRHFSADSSVLLNHQTSDSDLLIIKRDPFAPRLDREPIAIHR